MKIKTKRGPRILKRLKQIDVVFEGHAKKYVQWCNPLGKRVLDLGASNGDYAVRACEAGALRVLSFEGNSEYETIYRENTVGLPCELTVSYATGPDREFTRQRHSTVNIHDVLSDQDFDIVKMDVEGHEFEILPYTFKKGVRCLILEYHPTSIKRVEAMKTIHNDLIRQGFIPSLSESQLPTGWPKEVVYTR